MWITLFLFFFNETPTTEIYTLSLHDALPISPAGDQVERGVTEGERRPVGHRDHGHPAGRSEEHTSELQSRPHLVCRLLLEKKNLLARKCVPYDAVIVETGLKAKELARYSVIV